METEGGTAGFGSPLCSRTVPGQRGEWLQVARGGIGGVRMCKAGSERPLRDEGEETAQCVVMETCPTQSRGPGRDSCRGEGGVGWQEE